MVAVLDKTGNYKYAEKTFYVQVNGINESETEESEASSETHTDLNDDNHEISTEETDVKESTVETTESRETVTDGSESAAGLNQTETTEETGLKTTDASEERAVEQKKGTFKSRIYIY